MGVDADDVRVEVGVGGGEEQEERLIRRKFVGGLEGDKRGRSRNAIVESMVMRRKRRRRRKQREEIEEEAGFRSIRTGTEREE